MREGRRTIRASRDGVVHDVVVAWRLEGTRWRVTVVLPAADGPAEVGAEADDAFEALCRVRDELEPLGWRLGVAGAQPEVWPSGMARDQGGGLRAYRMTAESAGDLVDTFAPVDPATVVTVAAQQAVVDGLVPGLATPRGATTLEMYLHSRGAQMPRWDGTPEVEAAWKDVSQKYAEAASGDVRVVLGESLRPGNVWETREFDTLVNNEHVTRIIAIDARTGAMSVLFQRKI